MRVSESGLMKAVDTDNRK